MYINRYEYIRKYTAIQINSGGRSDNVKGPAHSKNENLYFLVPAQTQQMQPILVSCEAPFWSNLQKKNIGLVGGSLKGLKITII